MKLPELSADAAPEFVDAATCKKWLEDVPLANVAAAQQDLLVQLAEFNRFPTGAGNRLTVLEALREAVHFVQIEQAKRFTNRALPMAAPENEAFEETIDLWEQVRTGYLRCLEAALNRDNAMRAQAALVCQRALAYSGLKMFHHYRAYREVPQQEWRALNETYAHAEELDVAEELVKDFLNRDNQEASPRIAYARAVLLGLSSANELAQRQLTFVAYLLERWAGKLEVSAKPVDEGEGVPPLVADLASDRCPERVGQAPNGARYLDARKLAKSLRNRVGLLRKGESPAKLALGEDCVQPSCEQMLVYLYRQWCQARPARGQERRPANAAAQVCTELAGIHYYITGAAFRQPGGQPGGSTEMTQKQRLEMETLGFVSRRDQDDYSSAQGFLLEAWQIGDESAQGLRAVRPSASHGKRLAHGQLIALRPGDAKNFILAQVRWLMASDNGNLHVGLKLLPGLPSGVGVKPTGLNAQNEKFVPALALGAVATLNSPQSLVLPSGWFKPKRVIEVLTDSGSLVRLTEVLERGTDFERVAFEPVT